MIGVAEVARNEEHVEHDGQHYVAQGQLPGWLELAPGTAARIDAGSHTRWHVSDDFSELWFYV